MDFKIGTGATGTAKFDRVNEGLYVNGEKVLGAQGSAIADIATADGSDAATTQALANATKAKVNVILAALRAHGLIDT